MAHCERRLLSAFGIQVISRHEAFELDYIVQVDGKHFNSAFVRVSISCCGLSAVDRDCGES